MFKIYRRPSATKILVVRCRTSVVGSCSTVVGAVAACRRLLYLVAHSRREKMDRRLSATAEDNLQLTYDYRRQGYSILRLNSPISTTDATTNLGCIQTYKTLHDNVYDKLQPYTSQATSTHTSIYNYPRHSTTTRDCSCDLRRQTAVVAPPRNSQGELYLHLRVTNMPRRTSKKQKEANTLI